MALTLIKMTLEYTHTHILPSMQNIESPTNNYKTEWQHCRRKNILNEEVALVFLEPDIQTVFF